MSRSHVIPVLVILLLGSGLALDAAESRLRAAGDELRDEPEPARDGHDADDDDDEDHHHHHHPNAYTHAHGGTSFSHGGVDLVIGVFVGLRAISIPAYDRYPYDRHDTSDGDEFGDPDAAKLRWNSQLGLLGGGDGADLHWLGGSGRVMSPIGLGLGGQWLHYVEEVADETVDADLFDVSLVWRGFELPYGIFDWSLGYLGFHDTVGTENGAHFGLDLTVFPLRPLIFEAGASWGGINSVSVQRYHLAAGASWQHASLSIGYRWTDIGAVDLDGWELRCSWWF